MPQIGKSPAPSCRTSGCIGHVKITRCLSAVSPRTAPQLTTARGIIVPGGENGCYSDGCGRVMHGRIRISPIRNVALWRPCHVPTDLPARPEEVIVSSMRNRFLVTGFILAALLLTVAGSPLVLAAGEGAPDCCKQAGKCVPELGAPSCCGLAQAPRDIPTRVVSSEPVHRLRFGFLAAALPPAAAATQALTKIAPVATTAPAPPELIHLQSLFLLNATLLR